MAVGREKLISGGLFLAGAGIAAMALLPGRVLSGWILAFSYDNEVEHLWLLIVVARTMLALLGALTAAHAAKPLRMIWSQRLLPAPPRQTDPGQTPTHNAGKSIAVMTAVLAVMNLPVLIGLVWRPDWLGVLLQEDGVYEDLQACAFFLAAGLTAYAALLAVRYVRPIGLPHFFIAFLALALLFVALEEISYGQRILHFSTPQGLIQLNQQDEFNLHNVATGLTNRLFALTAISGGVFVSALALVSGRVRYLFKRSGIPLPRWPTVLAFAMAAAYTTPRQFRASLLDEQRLLSLAVPAVLVTLGLVCLRRKELRGFAVALLLFVAVLIATESIIAVFSFTWPVGNFAEEAKEWFIAFGFLCYSFNLARLARKARQGAPAGRLHIIKHRPLRLALAWGVLAAALVAAFGHNFAQMWARWFPAWHHVGWSTYDRIVEGESYYTHGPLIPLVSLATAALLIRYTKIPVRPRRVAGAIVVALSAALHLTSTLARVNFASAFAFVGLLGGLVLLLWGWEALRRLWFPIALLLFMVPLPEVSIAQVNFRLKMFAADWAVRSANFIGVLAERSGNTVFLEGEKSLVVANVCNGLRTLISLLAFGAIYAYICRLGGLWKLLLFAMSIPVAVVSNSLRVVSLILVADTWGVDAATGWYHDTSGLLIYAMAFGMMFGLERIVLWGRAKVGKAAPIVPLFHYVRRSSDDRGQATRLAGAVATPAGLTATVAMAAVAGAIGWLNMSVRPGWNQRLAREALPMEFNIAGSRLHSYDVELDQRTLAVLESPDYICRRYIEAGKYPLELSVIFGNDNRKGTHPPDLCLEGGGQDIVAKADLVIDAAVSTGKVPCRELIVESGKDTYYYLYTYKSGRGYTNSFWKQQSTIFTNGLLGGNTAGALIRISTQVENRQLDQARLRAVALLRKAAPYLDRILQ